MWPRLSAYRSHRTRCAGCLQPCGDVSLYCPEGSATPTRVRAGYFTVGNDADTSNSTRVDEVLCPLGHYCVGGVLFQCPSGRFGASEGLSSAACSGVCAAGYYCPDGSTSAKEFECGGVDKWCPEGSSWPQVRAASSPSCVAVSDSVPQRCCAHARLLRAERAHRAHLWSSGRHGCPLHVVAAACSRREWADAVDEGAGGGVSQGPLLRRRRAVPLPRRTLRRHRRHVAAVMHGRVQRGLLLPRGQRRAAAVQVWHRRRVLPRRIGVRALHCTAPHCTALRVPCAFAAVAAG
jgi:hypothetical protein